MMWFEHKIDSELSKTIRRDLRLYRREKGKGGHKFAFNDVLSIASTDVDGPSSEHAIVTHHQDAAWQHYWRHPERGWMQQKSYETRAEACAAVEVFTPPKVTFQTAVRDPGNYKHESKKKTAPKDPAKPKETVTYRVVVEGDRELFRSKPAASPWVEEQMRTVFARLGMSTRTETVTT